MLYLLKILLAMGALLSVLGVTVGLADDGPSKNTINGRVWELRFFTTEGKPTETRTFLATPEGNLYNRSLNQLGKYTEKGEQVEVILDPVTRLHAGTHKLLRWKNEPPTYRGVWTLTDGSQRRVELRLLRD